MPSKASKSSCTLRLSGVERCILSSVSDRRPFRNAFCGERAVLTLLKRKSSLAWDPLVNHRGRRLYVHFSKKLFFLRTIRPKFAYVLDGVKTLWNTSTFIRGIISSILLNGEVFIQEVEIKCCWQATVLECALWLEGLVEFAEARSKMRLLWSLNGNEKQFGIDTCSLQRSS